MGQAGLAHLVTHSSGPTHPQRATIIAVVLAWAPNRNDPEVFHITHLANLPGIIGAGGLHCDATMANQTTGPTSIGSTSIKQRRLAWSLNLTGAGAVGDYVPFYFCPRSVMLYSVSRGHAGWRGGQDDVVHLVSRVSKFSSTQCVFTDSNAATAYHNAAWTLGSVSLDWNALPETDWRDPAVKRARQAEFLVPKFAAWSAVERIVCRTDTAMNKVLAALQIANHRPIVDVDPRWYY